MFNSVRNIRNYTIAKVVAIGADKQPLTRVVPLPHDFFNDLPNLQHRIITPPLPNNAHTHRPATLTQPSRNTQSRQASERCRDGEHVLDIGAQIAQQIFDVEQRCGLDRGRMEEDVNSGISVVRLRVGDEYVSRAEYFIEICADQTSNSLSLKEVVIERAVIPCKCGWLKERNGVHTLR